MAKELEKVQRRLDAATIGVVVFLLLASTAAGRPAAVENSTTPTKETVRRATQLPAPPPPPPPESTVWVSVSVNQVELPGGNKSLVFYYLPRRATPPSAPSLGGNDIKT
ncbi:unnamed protein product [Spirodela intermedia]|uniref:Uncharacterized protein n=1 Tax=Spirodela intermedia TaxID=51605 RepID=A0A7I8JZ18_SPIIN|nr:unnamed protein product [Spirodela intermedia]